VRRPQELAGKLLGKTGVELWSELRGIRVYGIVTESKDTYLSISKTKTFSPQSGDRELVKAQLFRNMESAFIKLRRHGLSARNITAYLRAADFSYKGAEGRLTRHSSSTLDFTRVLAEIFEHIFEPGVIYRATGAVLSDIISGGPAQSDLFDDPVGVENIRKISVAVDAVNSHYGKHTLHLASSNIVNNKPSHPRNCIAWRQANLLKGETSRRRLRIPLLKNRDSGRI
jgi:hypothetical protein